MSVVALVTGAAGGIGRATALRFAEAGAQVMLTDVQAEGLAETAGMIAATGGEAKTHLCDISTEDGVAGLMQATLAAYGRLDWAFNNAGIIGPLAGIDRTDPVDFDRVMAVNVRSIYLCMKAELEIMGPHGRGAIVNNASAVALKVTAGPFAYTASKHAVKGMTEHAAHEWAPSGIRINAVAPGAIVTPMTLAMRAVEDRPSPQPNKRRAAASEVAEGVYWLCSDAASNVIGHMLVIDGGWTIG